MQKLEAPSDFINMGIYKVLSHSELTRAEGLYMVVNLFILNNITPEVGGVLEGRIE